MSYGPRALSGAGFASASQTWRIVISDLLRIHCLGYVINPDWGGRPFWRGPTFWLWGAKCLSNVVLSCLQYTFWFVAWPSHSRESSPFICSSLFALPRLCVGLPFLPRPHGLNQLLRVDKRFTINSSATHHLLWLHGFFHGIVSSTVFEIALASPRLGQTEREEWNKTGSRDDQSRRLRWKGERFCLSAEEALQMP